MSISVHKYSSTQVHQHTSTPVQSFSTGARRRVGGALTQCEAAGRQGQAAESSVCRRPRSGSPPSLPQTA
eukprot:1864741-Rhodomonas_salina.2